MAGWPPVRSGTDSDELQALQQQRQEEEREQAMGQGPEERARARQADGARQQERQRVASQETNGAAAEAAEQVCPVWQVET